jgi:hypothetical protein
MVDEATEVEEYTVNLTPHDRVFCRYVWNQQKMLIDFCLEQQACFTSGRWSPIRRFDTAHGVVHADNYVKGGKKARKETICDLEQIEQGCEIAEVSLYDKWEVNKRRYLRG